MFTYQHKIIELVYETGYHFKIEYLSSNRLRWTSLKERTDGAPLSDEETFYLNQQDSDIFTISWIESTGISVTQNLNFKSMEVYAFMSWNDDSKRGGRNILAHRGSIAFIKP